ncbi:MAG: DUF3298 domain-containing protein [Pyrinomonadaceae bacterium]
MSAFVLIFVLAAAVAFGQKPEMWFQGSIYSDKGAAPFNMSLTREGTSLVGSYYYLRSGAANKLTLRGVIAGDGSFTMQEFDAAGKQTGEFKGKLKEELQDPGVTLEGDWTKTGAKDAVSFIADQQMIYFAGGTHFTTLEAKESIRSKSAKLSAEYPQLVGARNAAGFNVAAKAVVDRAFADFRKTMAGFTVADIRNTPADIGNYLDIGYSIDYADDDLVSVQFLTDDFTGGVHPNQGYYTLTYDLAAGKEVRLADLFKPGASYLRTIADYCAKDLRARKDPESGENRGLATDIFADGVKPTADNFRDWAITKKGLLILFSPYQVASYAEGPQSVIVPYSALKNIARADGPLAKAK